MLFINLQKIFKKKDFSLQKATREHHSQRKPIQADLETLSITLLSAESCIVKIQTISPSESLLYFLQKLGILKSIYSINEEVLLSN